MSAPKRLPSRGRARISLREIISFPRIFRDQWVSTPPKQGPRTPSAGLPDGRPRLTGGWLTLWLQPAGPREGPRLAEAPQYDAEADAIGSYFAAIAEIGRRVKAGEEPLPTTGYFSPLFGKRFAAIAGFRNETLRTADAGEQP